MQDVLCPMCGAPLNEADECRSCGERRPSPFDFAACRLHPIWSFAAFSLLTLVAAAFFFMIWSAPR